MLAVLREQSDSWGVQLEETLRNALIALAETDHSLLELEPLLENAPFRKQLPACAASLSASKRVRRISSWRGSNRY
jgi:hypothetical protein